MVTRFLFVSALSFVAIGSAACGGKAESAAPPAAADAGAVRLAAENVATATTATLASGPAISGQLTPAREATVRAQVGGSIVSLTVDRGQAVRAGAVIAKISSRDLDVAFESANAAVTSADTAVTVAKSELQRTESLVKGGALAARDLEQARNALANAEAMLAAAKARQRAAWQQLDDTSVKAPWSGLVSDRQANQGDVVTAGAPIVTIVDPSSMRLEALVPSDQIAQVKVGAKVRFTVRGYPDQPFIGAVERFSPVADPVTRQVSIFVSVPNSGGKLIGGLFAEGRIEAQTREGVVVPASAVDETGAIQTVTRIRDGKAERVPVTLGLRQAERELIEIASGVAAGDVLIVGSAKGVAPGTPVVVLK